VILLIFVAIAGGFFYIRWKKRNSDDIQKQLLHAGKEAQKISMLEY